MQPKFELEDTSGESVPHRVARGLGKAAAEGTQFVVWSVLIGGGIAVGAALGIDIAEHLSNTVPVSSELDNFLECLSFSKPVAPEIAVVGMAGGAMVKLLSSSETEA